MIFVLVHTSSGDQVRVYEGLSQAVINLLLQGEGHTGDFIDEKAYNAFIEAHKLPVVVPDPIKAQAKVIIRNPLSTSDQKIGAIITLLDLDR